MVGRGVGEGGTAVAVGVTVGMTVGSNVGTMVGIAVGVGIVGSGLIIIVRRGLSASTTPLLFSSLICHSIVPMRLGLSRRIRGNTKRVPNIGFRTGPMTFGLPEP